MDVIAPLGESRIPDEKLFDLVNFGRYMLCIATNSQEALHDPARWIEIARRRSENLGGAISYLINLEQNATRNINEFLANISYVMVTYIDASLQYLFSPAPFVHHPDFIVIMIIWKDIYLEN